MKDWLFKPILSPFDIFMIFLISEWTVPSLGFWAIPIIIVLIMISTRIQELIWKVSKK